MQRIKWMDFGPTKLEIRETCCAGEVFQHAPALWRDLARAQVGPFLQNRAEYDWMICDLKVGSVFGEEMVSEAHIS